MQMTLINAYFKSVMLRLVHLTATCMLLLDVSSSLSSSLHLLAIRLTKVIILLVAMQFLDPLRFVIEDRLPLLILYAFSSFSEILTDTSIRQLSQFVLSLVFFHTSECILAITIHGASNVTLSSFLISKHYTLAMFVSLLEYITEITLFPELKQFWWVSNFGLIMIIIGEIIRKAAIITAGKSFTHQIKINHEEHHRLVTHGVYRLMRHPSYCGFLIWSVGTQVMLCNPISTVMFMVVVWRFFSQRIPYEEHFLKQFFGVEYIEYAESVPSGVPFGRLLAPSYHT